MKTLLTFGCFLLCIGVNARPVPVIMADVFASSSYIGEVIIESYDSSGRVRFRPLNPRDTLKEAFCTYILPPQNNTPVQTQQLPGTLWTSTIPLTGDTVLIFINHFGYASLMGKIIGKNYRIWMPAFSTSAAFFIFEPPIMPPDASYLRGQPGDAWDGCLIPVKSLHKLTDHYRKELSIKLEKYALPSFSGTKADMLLYDKLLSLFYAYTIHRARRFSVKSLELYYHQQKKLVIIPEENTVQSSTTHTYTYNNPFRDIVIKDIYWLQ